MVGGVEYQAGESDSSPSVVTYFLSFSSKIL